MMVPVGALSAFLNNTPIVALMIPILISWAHRVNVSKKVLLIPLSYACIFGGTLTLIGTSTNLVVSGLQAAEYKGTPDAAFGFFEIAPYGVPYAATGLLYVIIFARWLLPDSDGAEGREHMLMCAKLTSNTKVWYMSG